MTPVSIKMCRSSNGVSRKHGEVSRALWHKMFDQPMRVDEVPITYVTNGVHAPTWIAPAFQRLYEKNIGADWAEILKDERKWRAAIERIPDYQIWETHKLLKQLMISFVRERIYSSQTGLHDTINENENSQNLFDADFLTVGFGCRVVAY